MVAQLSSKLILNKLIQKVEFLDERVTDAAVLLAITNEPEPKILLTKRSETMSHHAGEVSLPGGRKEDFEYTNQEVVLREVFEELGMEAKNIFIIGELPSQLSLGGLVVTPLVAIIPPNLKILANPEEVSEVFYIPLNYFLVNQATQYIAKYPNGNFQVSCIKYEEKIIWGLTARIIISLFELVLNYKKEWKFYSEEIA